MIDAAERQLIEQHVPDVMDIVGIAQNAADFLNQFRKNHPNMDVSFKGDKSPVTEADKGTNNLIIECLKQTTPDLAVVSEENNVRVRDQEIFWAIDPLDGTSQFINGETGFSVNIALMYRANKRVAPKPILGVVACPALDSVYYSTLDNKSFVIHGNEKPRQLKTRLADPDHLAVGFNKSCSPTEIYDNTKKRLQEKFNIHLPKDPINVGDIIPHLLVAEGYLDAYLKLGRDKSLKGSGGFIWDNAALEPIVIGAGGNIVSLRNHEISIPYKGRAIRQPGYAVVGDPTEVERYCSPNLSIAG